MRLIRARPPLKPPSRAKARKAEQQAASEPVAVTQAVDPRKAAVEAAIARAKARKAEQQAASEPVAVTQAVDPRKAAVEAAIARAKARKASSKQPVNLRQQWMPLIHVRPPLKPLLREPKRVKPNNRPQMSRLPMMIHAKLPWRQLLPAFRPKSRASCKRGINGFQDSEFSLYP